MSWTAQPLGSTKPALPQKAPGAAWLAVLHMGSPRGLSEGALGREKAAKAKVLKPEWGSRPEQVGYSTRKEQSRVWDGWAGSRSGLINRLIKKGRIYFSADQVCLTAKHTICNWNAEKIF